MGGKSSGIQARITEEDVKLGFKEFDDLDMAAPELHTWPRYLWNIRQHVRQGKVENFLTWSTLHATMFVGNGAHFTEAEMKALKDDGFDRWKIALAESDVGNPLRLKGHEYTSGNLVHQAFHLMQWEQLSGKHVEELESIVEFGGGYGSMCAIVRRLGFEGKYTIIDNLEMSLLQQYYLSNLGFEATFSQTVKHNFVPPGRANLLIAAYSLSEVSEELRSAFLSETDFDEYLFVHQGIYAGMLVREMFDPFAKARSDKEWIDRNSPIRAHRYLIGLSGD